MSHSPSQEYHKKLSLDISFTATATTQIYTLSLHDALPICCSVGIVRSKRSSRPSTCTPRIAPSSRTRDRKSTRLNSSHVEISYAVFCLKKKKKIKMYVTL